MQTSFSALLKSALVAVVLVVTSTACSHGRIKFQPGAVHASNEASGQPGVAITVPWIKNKGNAMDIEVVLENNYNFPVHFNSSSWKLVVNGVPGTLHYQNFSGNMVPNSSETQLVSFEFAGSKHLSGTGELSLNNMFSDTAKRKIAPVVVQFSVNK